MLHKLLILTRPLFVIDTETTGIDPKTDRIVEIGFQKHTNEGMTKEWLTLVNPGVPIPASASKVHGIYDADMLRCQACKQTHTFLDAADSCNDPRFPLTFKQLAPNLATGFAGCDYAGKNCRFDLRILAAEMKRAGVEWSYADARIVDVDRLEQLAVPRDLGSMHANYVRTSCELCSGRGWKRRDDVAPHDVEICSNCKGAGKTGKPHDGAHGALSDVQASTRVIVGQLEAHASLPRDLDLLHAKQWPGWLTADGEFRMVDGVPTCAFGKAHKGKAMRSIPTGYWDWMLREDFPADVKQLVSAAKMGRFPEGSKG